MGWALAVALVVAGGRAVWCGALAAARLVDPRFLVEPLVV